MTREEELKKIAREWEEYKNEVRKHITIPAIDTTDYKFAKALFETEYDVVVDLLGEPTVGPANENDLEKLCRLLKNRKKDKETLELRYHLMLQEPVEAKFEVVGFTDEGIPEPLKYMAWYIFVEDEKDAEVVRDYLLDLFEVRVETRHCCFMVVE